MRDPASDIATWPKPLVREDNTLGLCYVGFFLRATWV